MAIDSECFRRENSQVTDVALRVVAAHCPLLTKLDLGGCKGSAPNSDVMNPNSVKIRNARPGLDI